MTSSVTQPPVYVDSGDLYIEGDTRVRYARQEDAELAGRLLVNAFYGKMSWAVGNSRIPGLINFMRDVHKLREDRFHRILIAEHKGEPAGLCELRVKQDPKEPDYDISVSSYIGCWGACRLACLEGVLNSKVPAQVCMVDVLCVNDRVRGQGIGKVLLDCAEVEGRKLGCQMMMLYVAKENRAKNLYEREGYEAAELEDGCCLSWCSVGVRYFYRMEKTLRL